MQEGRKLGFFGQATSKNEQRTSRALRTIPHPPSGPGTNGVGGSRGELGMVVGIDPIRVASDIDRNSAASQIGIPAIINQVAAVCLRVCAVHRVMPAFLTGIAEGVIDPLEPSAMVIDDTAEVGTSGSGAPQVGKKPVGDANLAPALIGLGSAAIEVDQLGLKIDLRPS